MLLTAQRAAGLCVNMLKDNIELGMKEITKALSSPAHTHTHTQTHAHTHTQTHVTKLYVQKGKWEKYLFIYKQRQNS